MSHRFAPNQKPTLTTIPLVSLAVFLMALSAAVPAAEPPSFSDPAAPAGWTVEQRGGTTTLKTDDAVTLPSEIAVRSHVGVGELVTVQALDAAADTNVLLEGTVRLTGDTQAAVVARAGGQPMATDTISTRTWNRRERRSGAVVYNWRYPKVKNLWDERDRREIGAAYAALVPFAEKEFVLRLVLTGTTRQIWVDDRLVAEEPGANPAAARWVIRHTAGAKLVSASLADPTAPAGFIPLPLIDYSHARAAHEADAAADLARLTPKGAPAVPVFVPAPGRVDIDLGESLYRYRLTAGSGPDAPYVNALRVWPGPFTIDPAVLTFRVPYRAYQNVWLLAWVDDERDAVPRGTFRFYREQAGYAARTDFEISETAIRNGSVTKLDRKTADGKRLYLVRVPVDTDALYGFRDLADQFLDFELSKPVALGRSYPDPIYYGEHPAGPASSIHVVGITLEEAPFGYEVRPQQVAHVFERPADPQYTVTVTNTTTRPLDARVTLSTKSFDEKEQQTVNGRVRVPPGGSADVKLRLSLKRNGWHQLRTAVAAGGVTRQNTLSLLMLPPNTRSYGTAANEIRFGIWSLWGHYLPLANGRFEQNEGYLAMLRKLGLRRVGCHSAFLTLDALQRHDFLPKSAHTIVAVFHRLDENDPAAMEKMVADELAQVARTAAAFPETGYYYGGEWHLSREIQYAAWPLYTGDGDRDLTAEERARVERQTKIFTAIGRAIRAKYPRTKLYLQWGSPLGTRAFLKAGFPKELVDGFGMDAPMFELLPEVASMTGGINGLWDLRDQAQRHGWPRLPIAWCEGPFFPTNPGALTEREQAAYQIRYWLLGLAYGIENFEAGVVEFDGGNYYGAEHYGAGVFHRTPLENPKPAAAAIATATTMLCGADPAGGIDTGSLTTYCLSFRRGRTKEMIYALWRVTGQVDAIIKVRGGAPVVTDAMGNAEKLAVADGAVRVTIGPQPVWLTGLEQIEAIQLAEPVYPEQPAPVTRSLGTFAPGRWGWDGSEDAAYAHNHFAVHRIVDPNLKAEFGAGETGHDDAVAISLAEEPGDPSSPGYAGASRPLAIRYGALKPRRPILIPGKATALGLWVKGNASWGRVVFQVRDAKGELWTANGTKDDWNCDDTHGWSYVNFEGWRYVRFPLPGNHPYDGARELQTTWWGSRGGDGMVDLPLKLEQIYVEARNEVAVLGEMTLVPARAYKLAGLVAEYAAKTDVGSATVARYARRKPVPAWSGPSENPIAKLRAAGTGLAPVIKEFAEPHHFNDGRRMVIRFDAAAGLTYKLYLSLYKDGRGADLLRAGVKPGDTVVGFRPELPLYLFLTAVGQDKQESKPSAPYHLITKDNFAEK
ncbi:hypothetical protein HQ590_04495 [bacterium]|nr:hypothetical protein [bacterium]